MTSNVVAERTIKPVKSILEDTGVDDFIERAKVSSIRVLKNYGRSRVLSTDEEVAGKIRSLLIEQSCQCKYCGVTLREGKYEIDHITSLKRGGFHFVGNLQLLCKSCNVAKGTHSEDEFFAWVHRLSMFQWSKSEEGRQKAEKAYLKNEKYRKYNKKPKKKKPE